MNSKKPTDNAMKKTINRSALLGRASTMAVATAAAATASMFGATDAQAACAFETTGPLSSVTLNTPLDCVIIDDPISNNVIVNTEVEHAASAPTFLVENSIGGRLLNNGVISNFGGESSGIALHVYGDSVYGGIYGGITNTGRISADKDVAIGLSYGAFVGGIQNTGEISGYHGIDGIDGFVIGGNIVNEEDALIHGDHVGIRIVEETGALYGTLLDGNISNRGTIEGGSTAILISTDSTNTSIFNDSSGVIRATDESESPEVAIRIESYDAYMDLNNSGRIQGIDGGFLFSGENFHGIISNRGEITSQGSIGAVRIGVRTSSSGLFLTSTVSGSLTNSGLIDGGEGWGVVIEAGDIAQPGTILTAGSETSEIQPLDLSDEPYVVSNRGEILGGILVSAYEASLDVFNRKDGIISSVTDGPGTGLALAVYNLDAEVQNDGLIEGSSVGMSVACDPLFGCKNPIVFNSLEAPPEVTPQVSLFSFVGVTNRGVIQGGTTGLLLETAFGMSFISNSGTVQVTPQVTPDAEDEFLSQYYTQTTGLLISPDTAIACVDDTSECYQDTRLGGQIHNSGLIRGDDGVAIHLTSFDGLGDGPALLNTGDIVGTDDFGLLIDVSDWYGDVVNSGLINGAETGAYLYGETFEGNFTNDGEVRGGGSDTGLHLAFNSFTGNVVNNVLLSALGKPLHVEADTFTGSITNNGTILATGSNKTAALITGLSGTGYYSGNFSNTGLVESDGGVSGTGIKVDNALLADGIINDGGTISALTAIDTQNAYGPMDIVNRGDGYIDGDVLLNHNYGDFFYGESGGIRGDIVGDGSVSGYDDNVIVQYGDHYFIGNASELQAFTVKSGTAFMGAEGEYADLDVSSLSTPDLFYGHHIDTLEVQAGARLYMGADADFEVGSYTQDPDGELTFFLSSDESEHGQIRNPAASGSIQLGGTISVDLDVASFAGKTTNTFTYEDVIVSNALTGSFVNDSVIVSSFFEVDVIQTLTAEAGDPGDVDLRLTRRSFGSLSCDTSTENNAAVGQMLEAAFVSGEPLTDDQLALYSAILNSSDGCDVAQIYDDLSGTPFDFIAFQLDGPFKKMVGARIDSGRSTGCVVAGSSDCFNRYAADTTAGSTVMNDATPGGDPFAWLRSGVREEGASAVWGRGVGVWGETDGDTASGAPGSRYDQRGGIIGADHVFSQTFIAGVAAQYTDTDIKFPGQVDRVAVNSYEAGAYASLGDTQGYINANASYIWHSFDTYRQLSGSDTRGQFDGGTVSACLEVGRIYEADGWRLQPVGVLSFASLSTDGYTENGTSLSRLVVKDSGFDSLKSILGGRIAYPVEMESGRRWVPEVRVSWSHEFMDNSAEFDARLISFAEDPSSYFTTKGAEYDRDSVNLGTGMNAPINDKIIVYLDYDASLSSDQTSQTASAGMRVLW